jgi:hypothetical protein
MLTQCPRNCAAAVRSLGGLFYCRNFRDTYNMIACISSNPKILTHTVYTSGEHNDGMAAAFVSFCQMMVHTRWLVHNEILVLDNAGAGIHSSLGLDFFLWAFFLSFFSKVEQHFVLGLTWLELSPSRLTWTFSVRQPKRPLTYFLMSFGLGPAGKWTRSPLRRGGRSMA